MSIEFTLKPVEKKDVKQTKLAEPRARHRKETGVQAHSDTQEEGIDTPPKPGYYTIA